MKVLLISHDSAGRTGWRRRTVIELPDKTACHLLSLPDLVEARKTQRDKDWPMVRRLDEAHYFQNQSRPNPAQIRFWFQELRTPDAAIFPEQEIADDRLRLMFVCCHPSNPAEAQVALALKTLCGNCPKRAAPFIVSLTEQQQRNLENELQRRIIVLKIFPHSLYDRTSKTKQKSRQNIMSAQNNHGYMLIFRGTDWHQGLSPEQMQQIADTWMAWFNRLKIEGKAVAGNPLEREVKIVSGKYGMVSDGPFAESKEAIGGYFLLRVGSMDEAVAIAQECPGLPYGIRVEVRPVAGECPVAAEARTEAQLAHA